MYVVVVLEVSELYKEQSNKGRQFQRLVKTTTLVIALLLHSRHNQYIVVAVCPALTFADSFYFQVNLWSPFLISRLLLRLNENVLL